MRLLPLALLSALLIAGCVQDAALPTAPASPAPTKVAGSDTTISACGATCNAVIGGAASRFETVRLAQGTFLLNGAVSLPSNTRVVGAGRTGTIIRQTAASAHGFVAAGTMSTFVTNITVDSLGFKGTGTGGQAALHAVSAKTVRFRHNQADSMGLIYTDLEVPGHENATASNLTRDILVTGNVANGPSGTNRPSIMLVFTRDGTITHNTLTGVPNGIFVWGGDARHTEDGTLTAERWARNHLIQHNTVLDVGYAGQLYTGGGIGVSMGDSVYVYDNNVQNCTDVCLDAEGSWNVWIQGNTGKNAGHAVLSSFYFNKNVVFAWNDVTQDGSYGAGLFALMNESLSEAEVSVAVTNNTFRYTGSTGIGLFTKEPSESLRFVNNTISNAVVRMEGCWPLACQWNGYLEITGNQFSFTRDAGVPVIKVGRNWVRPSWVAGNTFSTTVPQSGAGIHAVLDSHPGLTTGDHIWILDNAIGAFSPSVVLESSSNVAQSFHVEGNTGTGPCRTVFTGTGAHTLLVQNNSWSACSP